MCPVMHEQEIGFEVLSLTQSAASLCLHLIRTTNAKNQDLM